MGLASKVGARTGEGAVRQEVGARWELIAPTHLLSFLLITNSKYSYP
jgi:hypothetical protein